VTTLVNEEKSTGIHKVKFGVTSLSSEANFYIQKFGALK
jgi:hypothetical protein